MSSAFRCNVERIGQFARSAGLKFANDFCVNIVQIDEARDVKYQAHVEVELEQTQKYSCAGISLSLRQGYTFFNLLVETQSRS